MVIWVCIAVFMRKGISTFHLIAFQPLATEGIPLSGKRDW